MGLTCIGSQTSLTQFQAELDMLTHWHFAFKTNLTTGLTMAMLLTCMILPSTSIYKMPFTCVHECIVGITAAAKAALAVCDPMTSAVLCKEVCHHILYISALLTTDSDPICRKIKDYPDYS